MAKALKRIDVSKVPELLGVAQEVHNTQEPRLLRADNEDLAIHTPAKMAKRRKAVPAGKVFTRADSLFKIIGIAAGAADGVTDVSANKHKYLADAHASHKQ